MALQPAKDLLKTVQLLHHAKRFKGKIVIEKPKPPHFERSVFIELAKPWFINPKKGKPAIELCDKSVNLYEKDEFNPLEKFAADDLRRCLDKSRLVVLYHQNPMKGDTKFRATVTFKKENMHFRDYGRQTMQRAVKGTPYEALLNLYVSHNSLVFCPELDAKKVLRITKRFKELVVLAAIFEGRLISVDELTYYSQIPNIQTAQAALVQTLNSIGGNIVSQLNTHQSTLVQNLDARKKQLEDSKE